MENKKPTKKTATVKAKKETKNAIPVKETKKPIPVKETKKVIPLKDKKEVKRIVPEKGKKAAKKDVSAKEKKKSKKDVVWAKNSQVQDYNAAHSYLHLIYGEPVCSEMIKKLKAAPIFEFKADDIFRAANDPVLCFGCMPIDKDRKKIKKHIPLSPVLLVRDASTAKVIIADGYYRLCALYDINEDSVIPCKIV
jgi:hypothetical protein